jgi:hypothetical protein
MAKCNGCGKHERLDGEYFCLPCGRDYILPYVKRNLYSARTASDKLSLSRRVDALTVKINVAAGKWRLA